jgi:hypothetical protein
MAVAAVVAMTTMAVVATATATGTDNNQLKAAADKMAVLRW